MHSTTRKLTIQALMLVALLVPGAGHADAPAPSQQPQAKEHVVFQVSDASEATWNLTLANARNALNSLGKDHLDVEIVAYGPGIDLLRFESVLGDRIGQAIADGVHIVACQNTMKSKHLTSDDMLPTIGYVPVGVLELISKEHAGWAYVRP